MSLEMNTMEKTAHYGPKSPDDNHISPINAQFPQKFGGETDDLFWRYMFSCLSILAIIFTFPLSILFCVLIIKEYERVVIFRLGRLHHGTKGPGILFVLPCIEHHIIVDMRTFTANVPIQKVLTKDLVTVAVDAVVYYHIANATLSEINVQQPHESTQLLAQTILRSTFGRFNYSDILNNRDAMAIYMQKTLDGITDDWGIKIERVDIKQFSLPRGLQRSMAAEAEATREAKAKLIAAEGEKMASAVLKEAADVMSECPTSIQLRCLQTLNAVSANDNCTITFPLPVDLLYSLFEGFIEPSNDDRQVATKAADTSFELNGV